VIHNVVAYPGRVRKRGVRSPARPAPGGLALGAVLVLFAGCQPSTNSPAAALPPIDQATPEAVARSVLETVRAELKAVAAHDRAAAERARERLVQLAAAHEILKSLEGSPRFKTVLGDNPLRGYTDLWGATLAYYADGLALDAVSRAKTSEDGRTAAVHVPATGEGSRAVIEIACVRGNDGLWRVREVLFARAPAAASGPSTAVSQSRPASMPGG